MANTINPRSSASLSINDAISNNRFEKLIEKSQEGITLLDNNFRIIYRSPSSARINGWGDQERVKFNVIKSVHPDDVENVSQVLSDVLSSPSTSITCTFRTLHSAGHYIWIECVYTNYLNDIDINAIVCNFKDVTDKKVNDDLLENTLNELFAYKHALDESAIVAITDQRGIIRHVNDNFCKISKFRNSELIGQDHRIINSSYHDKKFISNLWKTIANGGIWKGELKNKAKDGSCYWVDTTIVPFIDETGKPYQYIAIRSDITERKLNQEQVIENEHFIKTITDNLPAMIAYWSADLHCLFSNKPLQDWFEKTPEQMLGIHKQNLMDKNEYRLYRPYIQNVLQGNAQSFERSFVKANGNVIYTHTQYVPDVQNGVIKGFYSLIYDYSEVRLAELEILKKTAQINDLLENITDGFIALDENMCYTYANKHIGKMLGRSPESLIGNYIWELFPDAVGSATYQAIQTAYLEKKYVCNEDYYAPANLWQENRVYPSGKGISMFIRDISVRKSAESQKELLSHISLLFNERIDLNEILHKVLEKVLECSGCSITEIWLINTGQQRINLCAKGLQTDEMQLFFDERSEIRSFNKGEGLPGETWAANKGQFWNHSTKKHNFARIAQAELTGLKSALSIPILYGKEMLGVLILHFKTNDNPLAAQAALFNEFSTHLGSEIKRKQLEQELNQVFNFTPDILCVANTDGYFKRVNPAMSALLEYSESDLLSRPFMEFVYPPDKEGTATELQNIVDGKPTYYIENRYLTKSGKIKWLAWTTTGASEQGTLYCSAKDITDKKDLEELLHKATSLARIGSWEIDVVNGTLYWSDITKQIHELPADFEPDLETGINFYKEGSDRSIITQKVQEIIEKGTPCDVELQIVTAKGNNKWVRVIGEAEFVDNKCIRIYGSFQDINALKEAEIAAKKILEERNTILESIGDAFFALDKNWVITYWNSMAEKVMGMSKNIMLGQNMWEVYPESVNSEAYYNYQKVIQTGQAIHFEHHSLLIQKWLEVSIYPAINGLTVYVKDISARKKAEVLATETMAERNTILESIANAFFAVDKNWIVTYWNNTAEKVLMKTKNEMVGKNLWEIFSDSIDSLSYKKYHEAIKSNLPVHFEDHYAPLSKWYEISAYPTGNGLSVYFKDVTERKTSDMLLKELNDALQKHAKELAISNAELEQFAYVASHDLQEPLRMITSFLTQLEQKYSHVVDEKGKKYIHFAVDGAKRMRQIILDLLEFSRVGRLEESIELVDINKIINDILPLYRKQIEEQNGQIIFDELPTLHTYKAPIRQVFQNLISNGLKYQLSGKPALITIGCTDEDDHWKFSVTDNGIGIDQEYYDKIFIIFQRLHNKEEYSGTGMGLAITKKIIESIGGRIWVESQEGNGSTFYFTILKK